MRQHLTWARFHGPPSQANPTSSAPPARGRGPRLHLDGERWQVFKDKLAVAAVLLLVLATLTVFVLYVVQQAPYFRTGELTGFATPAPGMADPGQQAEANAQNAEAASSIAGSGLSRIPLILISTVVEMAIFVALGLYLRHDMKRKP